MLDHGCRQQVRVVKLALEVGDSRSVLGKKKDDASPWESLELTTDHKPDLPKVGSSVELLSQAANTLLSLIPCNSGEGPDRKRYSTWASGL